MDWLRRLLGGPEGPLDDVGRGVARSPVRKANAHIHLPPNFSAFESVDQAVSLAAAQDVRILGASNYYDYSVYEPFARLCLQHGVYPLFGLEIIALLDDIRRAGVLINDPGNPGKMYLCGKGITRFVEPTAEAQELLDLIRRNDEKRMQQMASLLAGIFAAGGVETGLDDSRIVDGIVRRHGADRNVVTLQERHLAQAFQEEFFRLVPLTERVGALSRIFGRPSKSDPSNHVQVQNEIRSQLMKVGKPAFVEESFVDLEQARRLVLELGGIPCYPTLADGAAPVCAYEDSPDKLIRTLEGHGIHCAELIPLRNDPAVLERYVMAFRKAGVVVTGGTEHNTLDLVAMEPECRHRAPVPDAIRQVFLEGAHVVAAHQFLTVSGREGYVDGAGRLNAGFSDHEERIDYFRRVGEVVVAAKLAASGQNLLDLD